ncbi:hypothetical protein L917_06930, partial [Phytophthora nicotianae]
GRTRHFLISGWGRTAKLGVFELAVQSDTSVRVVLRIGSWTARCVAVDASDAVAGVETERTLRVGAKDNVLSSVTEGEVDT